MGKNGLAYLGKDILDRILDPWARMQFISKRCTCNNCSLSIILNR